MPEVTQELAEVQSESVADGNAAVSDTLEPGQDEPETTSTEEKTEDVPVDAGEKKAEGDDEKPAEDDLSERVKKRIGKEVAKRHAALRQKQEVEQDRDHWRREALKRMEQAGELPTAATKSFDDKNPRPSQSDFDDYEKYVEALAGWSASRKIFVEQTKQSLAEQEGTRNADDHAFRQTVHKSGSERYQDFSQVVLHPDVRISENMFNAIKKYGGDIAADLTYAIASDPKYSQPLASLDKEDTVAAIIDLKHELMSSSPEAETKKDEVKPTRKVTAAPAPITPLDGSAVVETSDYSKMSWGQFCKRREAEMKHSRR